MEEAAREAAYLRSSLEELDRLAPVAGEEAALADMRAAMMRAEKIAGEIHDAEQLLSGPQSPVAQLSALLRRLGRKASDAPELIEPVIRPLDEALLALDAAQAEVEAAVRAMDFDPHRLEEAETRLFALRAAARKHNVAVDDLAGLRGRFATELADLDRGEERLKRLASLSRESRAVFDRLAGALSAARRKAAGELASAVMAELPALKLEKAEFFVEVRPDPEAPAPTGIDDVEFTVRTNPGSRPGPLMKVASGGELSRFLLALKVVLADRGSAPTLVFDEIDTGAGGAVADAIGQRLARLSRHVQVLSVTHAPQVAARASTHYLITKSMQGKLGAVTAISRIEDQSRSEEIARMLAGASITEEARAAARRLLADTLPRAP
jgi:DNA repair protein RecN (Recombination protein N)